MIQTRGTVKQSVGKKEQCFSDASSNILHHICETNSRQFFLRSDWSRQNGKDVGEDNELHLFLWRYVMTL